MKKGSWKLNNPKKEKSEHAYSSYEDNQCEWILDSGASSRMSFNEKNFSQLRSMRTMLAYRLQVEGSEKQLVSE